MTKKILGELACIPPSLLLHQRISQFSLSNYDRYQTGKPPAFFIFLCENLVEFFLTQMWYSNIENVFVSNCKMYLSQTQVCCSGDPGGGNGHMGGEGWREMGRAWPIWREIHLCIHAKYKYNCNSQMIKCQISGQAKRDRVYNNGFAFIHTNFEIITIM